MSGRRACNLKDMHEVWQPRVPAPSRIELDLSNWPIMVTTPPARAVSDAELHDFLERFERTLRERSGRYVSVLDLRLHIGLTPKQQQMLARHMNASHAGFSAGRLSGTAMVFTSALMRSLLTGIFWLRKSKHPTAVFANLEDALDWSRRILSEQAARTG